MKSLFSILIVLAFIVVGCSNVPTSSSPSPQIEVNFTGSEDKEISTDAVFQNNCDGNAEVENEIAKSRSLEYTMEVQSGVSVNANGQIGFAGTDVELGATIATQLGQSYGVTESISRSITVKTSPGTSMQHTIRQIERWKTGNARITVGGQETIVPFKYRYDFSLELIGSENLGLCPTKTSNSSSTNATESTNSTPQSENAPINCSFPQVGWTPPSLNGQGEWVYDCLSSGEGNWVGQDEAWKAVNWKRGSSQSEIVAIIIPEGATKMGLGCDPCTVLKPDGTSISSPNGKFGPFEPNISTDVKVGEVYKVKIFGGDTCPSRPQVIPPCSPEIYIWFNLP